MGIWLAGTSLRSRASRSISLTMSLGGMLVACAAHNAGAALIVHGGPTYSAGVGYLSQSQPLGQGPLVADGFGVGQASRVGVSSSASYGIRFNSSDTFIRLVGPDDGPSQAYSMNAAGTVVGYSTMNALGTTMATRWNVGSSIGVPLTTAMSTGPNASSMGLHITSNNVVVGRFMRTDMQGDVIDTMPVRWNAAGVASMLDVPTHDAAGHVDATAYYANAGGTTAGTATTYNSSFVNVGHRAVRWNAVGNEAIPLDALPADSTGSAEAYVSGINDAGTIIGASTKYDSAGEGYLGNRPVRWNADATAATELGVLNFDPTGSASATPNAINNFGTIVGSSDLYDANGDYAGARAVRWDTNSVTAVPLGVLAGFIKNSEAYGINSSGDSVGYVDFVGDDGEAKHAVIWDDAGTALDLNSLIAPDTGWTLVSANGINDSGWISGIGLFDPDGTGGEAAYDRMFLIQLPEPTLGTAMLCATLSLMLRRRSAV